MTCIEKLRELHPDWDDEKVEYYVGHGCPVSEYICRIPFTCRPWDRTACEKCWNSEIPPVESYNKHQLSVWLTGEDMRRIRRMEERLGISDCKVVAAALRQYEEGFVAVKKSDSFAKEEMVIFDEQE